MRMKQHKRLQCPRHQVLHLCQQCPIEDTPTEPATSPRVTEVPVQRWAQELQLPTLEHGPREEPERFATRYILNDGTMTQEAHECVVAAKQPRHSTTRLWKGRLKMLFKGRKKHMNEVSRSGKRESQPKNSRIIMIFHVVHLQQELRLCVHFQMSMQHFVRMIPLRLHILNQSSRRLRRLREGRCHRFLF